MLHDTLSNRLSIPVFAVISLFLLSVFYTHSLRAGELHLVLNGKSFHIVKKPGVKLNERNFGAGFQYEFGRFKKHWTPYINAGGFSDSFEKPSFYIGGGLYQRFKLPNSSLHFDAGMTGFMMTKADVNDNKPFPGILPMISLGNDVAALNITYIPQIDTTGTDLWFVQLKFKIGHY